MDYSKILIALCALPCDIILSDEDGYMYYFAPRIDSPNGVFQIRYDRFYCEEGGRVAAKEYKDANAHDKETIASWNFPNDCDFHKELGSFLNYLQNNFSWNELHYNK
jgi:hypothetical protein